MVLILIIINKGCLKDIEELVASGDYLPCLYRSLPAETLEQCSDTPLYQVVRSPGGSGEVEV